MGIKGLRVHIEKRRHEKVAVVKRGASKYDSDLFFELIIKRK